MSADDPAPLGAGSSAATVMTKLRFRIYIYGTGTWGFNESNIFKSVCQCTDKSLLENFMTSLSAEYKVHTAQFLETIAAYSCAQWETNRLFRSPSLVAVKVPVGYET